MRTIQNYNCKKSAMAWGYPDTTVCFVDVVDFTHLCAELTPQAVVSLLDSLFGQLDKLTEQHRLKYIKTIKDAYMLASGVDHDEAAEHTERMFAFVLDVLKLIERHPDVMGMRFMVRIGIASGPVIAGILGGKRMQLDLWGDTVNLASRMCDLAGPMEIVLDEITYLSLSADRQATNTFHQEQAMVKGRGKQTLYRCSP